MVERTITQTEQKQQGTLFLQNPDTKIEQKQDEQVVTQERKILTWKEDTIDNENMNRLKSKVCCVYHKPKDSADQSSSTCTSDDEGNEYDRDRLSKNKHKEVCSKHKKCSHQQKKN